MPKYGWSVLCIGSAGHGNGQSKVKATGGRLDTREDIKDAKKYFNGFSNVMCYGEYEVGGNIGSASECLEYISRFMSACKRDNVSPIIYYTGHGDDVRGNWCFPSGTITFDDIVELYDKHRSTKVPYILSDCCHSGHWAWDAARLKERTGDKWRVACASNHNKLATNRVFAKACFNGDRTAQAALRAHDCDAVITAYGFDDTATKNFSGAWVDNVMLKWH